MTPSLITAPWFSLAACGLAYGLFVFVGEFLDPLRPPRGPLRRPRWRLGRRMGLASLATGLCTFWLPLVTPLTAIGGLLAGTLAGGVTAMFAMVMYRREEARMWMHDAEREELRDEPYGGEHGVPAPERPARPRRPAGPASSRPVRLREPVDIEI